MNTINVPQSWPRWLYRYLSGRPLDGRHRTDCGYLRTGTRVLTPSGHASRWAHLPGWKRQAWRLGIPAAAVTLAISYHIMPIPTAAGTMLLGGWGTYRGGRRIHRVIRTWRYDRTVLTPMAAALAPLAELPIATVRTDMTVSGTQVQVPLADHHDGAKEKVAGMVRIIGQRVGGEWEATPQFRQAPFYLNLTPLPAPPPKVTYGMIRDQVLATEQHKPILGLGCNHQPVYLDFRGEIAHLACSIGTQGGKSTFAKYLIAHFAHHGVADQLVCDVKQVSVQGMENTPGLRICRHVEEIWDAIADARAEMERRYNTLAKNPGRTFPRKVIYLEEQNAFALLTRITWNAVRNRRDPTLAPVWSDIGLLVTMAAQVNINLIGFYQRMAADVCGGGSYRDQYGMKLLGRFSPQAWDTLVGERPRGKSENDIQGRAISVMGGTRRTVQLPYLTAEELAELAGSGTPVTVTAPETQQVSPVSRCDVTPPTYSLAEAARQEWCTISYDNLRQKVSRAARAGRFAMAERYTREELDSVLGGDV